LLVWIPEDKFPLDLSIYQTNQDPYLNSCIIFLIGFTNEDLQYLTKEIILGGGKIAGSMNEATHVVVDSNLEEKSYVYFLIYLLLNFNFHCT
jgi:hypothetical protein